MRVAIDATALSVSTGGITRYVTELSRALALEFPEDEWVLVSDQPFPSPESAPPNLRRGHGPSAVLERRWWTIGVAREMARLGADLFHGPNFEVPYVPLRPSVLSLHDLSPWMDPAWHDAAGRVRRRTPALIRLGIATMVMTDSEAVRRAAIDRFGIHPGRIAAVPLAAAACFRPMETPAGGRRYFLYAGTLEPRKNVGALLEAWNEVQRDYAVDLVLAGRRRKDFPEIAERPGLELAGEVSDERMAALYSGALAVVYPTWYEGFGLPVLEAMQCGACVVTSRDPAVSEVAGGAAIQAGTSATELVAVLRALAAAPELALSWRERALARARQFSWQRTARLTREVYEEARARFGR